MDANEYQRAAGRTLLDKSGITLTDNELQIIWNALGLVGEAGEVSELIKKGILHKHGLDMAKVEKELGDVMWYISALCSKLGIQLSAVMEKNIAKLQERYPAGYNSAASINRVD
jgi:NTP pyrophosphatase (non-canonical NTP hydrolase)